MREVTGGDKYSFGIGELYCLFDQLTEMIVVL